MRTAFRIPAIDHRDRAPRVARVALASLAAAAPALAQQFAPPRALSTSYERAPTVLADLDGDGRADLLSPGANDRILWRRNLGGGVYAAAQPIWQPSGSTSFQQLHSLLAMDVDADGDADVVWSVQSISHQFPDAFAVWFVENQGGGAFGLRDHLPICVTYPEIVLLPADPDGDGDRDLVTFASTGSDLQIPVGGEVRWTDYPAPPSPPGPTCVLVDPDESTETRWAAECDVDDDGDLDLVRGDNWSIRWFENQGVAGFAQGAELMSTGYSHGGRFLDLDGDGDPDLLAARAAGSTGELVRRENTGGAVFGGEHVLWTGDPISRLSEPADLDGDGDFDLVAGDHGSAGVWLFERTGSTAFAAPVDLGALHVQQVPVDDLDADGDLDLIVRGSAPTEGLYWLENLHTTPGSLFCSGDGSAGAACPCSNASPAGAEEGCLNSTGNGARLRTSGSAIVTHDNLVLRVDRARPNQPFMLLQGRNQVALPFKDGILCAGAPTRRILRSTLDSDGGADTSGGSVVTEGAISGPGETRSYQAWFRDPQLSVCGTGSNFTNAVSIDWE